MEIKIKTPRGERVVGRISISGQYVTDRYPNHYFVKYQGFGISKKAIDKYIKLLKKDGWKTDPESLQVKIIYHGKKSTKIYITRLEKFLDSPYQYDDDGDIQYILPEGEMVLWKEIPTNLSKN